MFIVKAVRLKDIDDLECIHILDGDCVHILDVHVQPEKDECLAKDLEVEHVKQDDHEDYVVQVQQEEDEREARR